MKVINETLLPIYLRKIDTYENYKRAGGQRSY